MSAEAELPVESRAEGTENKAFWDSLEILRHQHWISGSFSGRGDFSFEGHLRFSGKWQGAIVGESQDSHLYVLAGASLKGRIKAARLSVEGSLEDVEVEAEWFHALPGSKTYGRIRAKHLVIEEGAVVQGRLTSLRNKDQLGTASGKLGPSGLGKTP